MKPVGTALGLKATPTCERGISAAVPRRPDFGSFAIGAAATSMGSEPACSAEGGLGVEGWRAADDGGRAWEEEEEEEEEDAGVVALDCWSALSGGWSITWRHMIIRLFRV